MVFPNIYGANFGLEDPSGMGSMFNLPQNGSNFNIGLGNGNNITNAGITGNGSVTGTGTDNNLNLGMNIPTLQLALGGLQSIGNLWGAYNSNKLAKKELNFTMDAYRENVNNQKKLHNNALEDRTRARGAFEGHSQEYMDDYNNRHRL